MLLFIFDRTVCKSEIVAQRTSSYHAGFNIVFLLKLYFEKL